MISLRSSEQNSLNRQTLVKVNVRSSIFFPFILVLMLLCFLAVICFFVFQISYISKFCYDLTKFFMYRCFTLSICFSLIHLSTFQPLDKPCGHKKNKKIKGAEMKTARIVLHAACTSLQWSF